MSEQEYSIENDPLFKPIAEDKKKIIDEAVKKHVNSLTLDENLSKDEERLSGQNYALISIVSPDTSQKAEKICLKIKGVFATLEEANKHAEILQKMDSMFDIYVVEMYSWLLLPPDISLIEQKHIDEKLNEIISGHKESQLKAKEYFNERKRELIDNINVENERRKNENEKLKEETITEVEQDEITKQIIIEPLTETETSPEQSTETETSPEQSTEQSTETETSPDGIISNSSINIADNGNDCPNSAPISTPSTLMENMVNDTLNVKPKKSWADTIEDEEN